MIRQYDVVALTEGLPGQGLEQGQVGTVVGVRKRDLFEVEFSDITGRVFASAALAPRQLLVLRYQPLTQAGTDPYAA